MEKIIKMNLNRILKIILSSTETKNALMDYFNGDITRNELENYETNKYFYSYIIEKGVIKELLEKAEETDLRNKVYEILFYSNRNLLFNEVKDKFKDKFDFYIKMRDIYGVDLKLAIKLELKASREMYIYKKFSNIYSKILWDLVGVENLFDEIKNIDDKFQLIIYLLSTNPKKGLEHIDFFEHESMKVIEKIVHYKFNIGNIKNSKILLDYIKEEKPTLDFSELRENLLEYHIVESLSEFIKILTYAGYKYSPIIKRFVKVLMINDYLYGTQFNPIELLKKDYSIKEKVELYVNCYEKIGAPKIYIINYFLNKRPYGEVKNWLVNYIKLQLDFKDIDTKKVYVLNKNGEKTLDYIFDNLTEKKMILFNEIYKEITGKSYKNCIIVKFEKKYRSHLLIHRGLSSSEIDKIFDYFDGKTNLNDLQDFQGQNISSNFYSDFNELLETIEKKEFEFYKKFIVYEMKKGSKNLNGLIPCNYFKRNNFSNILEYGLVEDDLIPSAFKALMYNSINYVYQQKSLVFLKSIDKKKLLKLAKENIKDFDVQGKKCFFDNLLNNKEGFLLLLENVGTSKILKELLYDKTKKLGITLVMKLLIENLKSEKIKIRSNVVELMIRLDLQKIPEILKKHQKIEKSKKIKEMIGSYINIENEDVKIKESYLKLLSGPNKRKLSKLEGYIIPVEDKEGNLLEELYSQLLISFYINYNLDEAVKLTNEIKEFIKEDSIKNLAERIYEWYKFNGFNSKDKEIAYFAIVNMGSLAVEEVKKDIKDLIKKSKGLLASHMVNALSYNKDNSILIFFDYVMRKIKHKQVKQSAYDALKLVAKTKNITLEELQDKIIPNFELDIRGEKIYDYGERTFKISLLPKGEFEIFDIKKEKIIKSLPKPNKSDVEERAEKAREEFKILKKQIKNNYKIQVERLENTLLTGRTWSKKSFEEIFVNNPIMREFCVNLVWGKYENNKLINTFRCMEDGSYNSYDESEYELSEDSFVGVVHPIELGKEELEAWKEQLEDYEIEQPFKQIERKIYKEEKSYIGKIAQGSSLNYRLVKYGWERGKVLGTGSFFTFFIENPLFNIGVELKHDGINIGHYEEKEIIVESLNFYYTNKVKETELYRIGINEDAYATFDKVPPRFYSEVINQLDDII